MSLLRLSHSVHLAVWTLTTVITAGSAEQACSDPPGVRATGLLADKVRLAGVRGTLAERGEDEDGGGMGVLIGEDGSGIGVFVGLAGGGVGDGVFGREDMVADAPYS